MVTLVWEYKGHLLAWVHLSGRVREWHGHVIQVFNDPQQRENRRASQLSISLSLSLSLSNSNELYWHDLYSTAKALAIT